MEFVPYFEGGSPPIDNGHVAFLRVRVTKDPEPNGYVIVYLPSGTALQVRGQDLLRVNDHTGSSSSQAGKRHASPTS